MELTAKTSAAQRVADGLAEIVLFGGAALIVWWQNTRLTVLYDLSGVLELAMRIAQGDMPYRDFPFAYAPLTFLAQAAMIRLAGAVYWHHIVYCMVIAGVSTLLTWRVIARSVEGAVPHPRLTAFMLAVPAVILSVYCVFPHPFYDPDAVFIILLCIWLLLRLERNSFPPIRTFSTGALLVVPLLVKQNIGIAFLASIAVWLIARIIVGSRRKMPIRGHLLLAAGSLAGLMIATTIVQLTCGIEAYKYWTWDFATARRAPAFADMVGVYADPWLALWLVFFLLGTLLFRRFSAAKPLEGALATLAMAMPFLWPVIYLSLNGDPSERAERLIGLWPFSMIALVMLGYIFTRRLDGVSAGLPAVLIATVHGTFLSQQLWGSTYALWPLLMVMIALLIRQLYDPEERRSGLPMTALAGIVSLSISVAGGFYIYANERLDYVGWEDGEMAHSALPQLSGMSMRGDLLPAFDELIAWTDANVPPEDGILNLPGEDLFYYTTGRRPHFPVLLFDVTNNPYTVDEIKRRVEASDIEWMIVKNDLEIEADDMIDSKDRMVEALQPDFRHVESLDNYEIFKRRHAGDPPDEEDDDSDDSDDAND